jgi:predicted enzyme related to lactoylglutathione lyase
MRSLSFNHLALAVKDVTAYVAFYKAVFGLSEIENTASNSATRWLPLGEGKAPHLITRPEAEIKTHKAIHFAMALDDIEYNRKNYTLEIAKYWYNSVMSYKLN